MTEEDLDRQFIDGVKLAIRRTVAALKTEVPAETLAGYALLTDDALETLSYLAVTEEALRTNSDPDLLFVPTDWPYESGSDAFDAADAQLRQRASVAAELRQHVDRSFGILVKALAESKAEGVFDPSVFISVLSTDPSKYLLTLWDSAVRRLNEPNVVEARERFLEKWS